MTLLDIADMTEDDARAFMERIRWPQGRVCPHCGAVGGKSYILNENAKTGVRAGLYKCGECGEQYSVTVGTVMHGSHIPIRKWVPGFFLMCDHKKGVSALQLQRDLGLGSYRTAWHMAHRIREAMAEGPLAAPLGGIVQVDDTRVGGKRKNMHALQRKAQREKFGQRQDDKPILMALVEKGGRAKTRVIAKDDEASLREFLNAPRKFPAKEKKSRRKSK